MITDDLIWDDASGSLRFANGEPFYGKATICEVEGERFVVLREHGPLRGPDNIALCKSITVPRLFEWLVRRGDYNLYEGDDKFEAIKVYNAACAVLALGKG